MTHSLFFAFSIKTPSEKLPKARLLREEDLHLTLAFLPQVNPLDLLNLVERLPLPKVKIGQGAYFKRFLPLPPNKPRALSFESPP